MLGIKIASTRENTEISYPNPKNYSIKKIAPLEAEWDHLTDFFVQNENMYEIYTTLVIHGIISCCYLTLYQDSCIIQYLWIVGNIQGNKIGDDKRVGYLPFLNSIVPGSSPKKTNPNSTADEPKNHRIQERGGTLDPLVVNKPIPLHIELQKNPCNNL